MWTWVKRIFDLRQGRHFTLNWPRTNHAHRLVQLRLFGRQIGCLLVLGLRYVAFTLAFLAQAVKRGGDDDHGDNDDGDGG